MATASLLAEPPAYRSWGDLLEAVVSDRLEGEGGELDDELLALPTEALVAADATVALGSLADGAEDIHGR